MRSAGSSENLRPPTIAELAAGGRVLTVWCFNPACRRTVRLEPDEVLAQFPRRLWYP